MPDYTLVEVPPYKPEKIPDIDHVMECCGTCNYHCRADDEDDWTCENEDSEFYAVWTDYEDCCDHYERR